MYIYASIFCIYSKKIPLFFRTCRFLLRFILMWSFFTKSEHFLSASNVFDMPIQAFHQVSLGAAPLALVPSVYALRADGKKIRPIGLSRVLRRSPPISVQAPQSRKTRFSLSSKNCGTIDSASFTQKTAVSTAAALTPRFQICHSWKEAGRTEDSSFRPNHS